MRCFGCWHVGYHDAVAPFPFRSVQGRIGGLKQFLLIRSLVGQCSNADGGRDYSEGSPVIHHDEIPQLFPNPLGSRFRGTQVRSGEDNNEFFAAVATHKIFGSDALD